MALIPIGLPAPFVALFAAAVLLLLAGHFVRALRMTTFFPSDSGVGRFDLLLSLALGYCVNTFVPARLGELVRVLYIGKRCRIRYAYVAATVACERLSDAVVLGVLCAALIASGLLPQGMTVTAATVLSLTAIGIAAAYLCKYSRQFRRAIWKAAAIFNLPICYGILDFAWSYSETVVNRQMTKKRYVLLTVVMWLFYAASYYVFGIAARAGLQSVVYEMLGSPLHSMLDRAIHGRLAGEEVMFLAFGVVPVLAILLAGLFRDKNALVRVLSSLFRGHFKTWDPGTSLVSERFKKRTEYDFFLTALFAGDDQRVSGFGLNAIEDAVVHRLFQGGSGAITALVEADGNLMIRKFAIGDLADKLRDQAKWLTDHRTQLPLVQISAERTDPSFFRYDMPYSPQANDFYDVIHTSPIEHSMELLTDVIATMHAFHQATTKGNADQSTVDEYAARKVTKNATAVLKFVTDLLPTGHYVLNGKEYTLDDWQKLQDLSWLRLQMTDRRTCQIHGDLTIENIVIDPSRPIGWYLIDPNPGNIFDSPHIDWAKLRQSLHLGYEGLNKAATCTWRGSELYLALTRSHAYDQLNEKVESMLQEIVGPHAHREVRFHELVNYLRLTPYKIRQGPEKGLAFFACTSILLASYLEETR